MRNALSAGLVILCLTNGAVLQTCAQQMAVPKPKRAVLGGELNWDVLLREQQSLVDALALSEVKDSDYATNANDLALIHSAFGEYAQAEVLFREAVSILQHQDNEAAWVVQGNLARVLREMGDYARAAPILRENLAQAKKRDLGAASEAEALDDLGDLHADMGDFDQAVSYYQQALSVRSVANLTEGRAPTLHNLALVYERLGDFVRAEQLLRQDVETTRSRLSVEHSEYAHSLESLAFLCTQVGKYNQAELLYEQALATYQKTVGFENPATARTLNNMGFLFALTGDFDRAAPLLNQALEIRRRLLGETHLHYADSLGDTARLHHFRSDYSQAEVLCRQALDIVGEYLRLTAAIQSERQQLAMAGSLRHYLDGYLSLTVEARLPAENVYVYVLGWKGAILARQRWTRVENGARDTELAQDFAELRSVASRLATLAFAKPEPEQLEARDRQMAELTGRKERLEAKLAAGSAEVRQLKAQVRVTPERLRASLPEGAVLIDLIEYTHRKKPEQGDGKWESERRLAAFVVRSKGPVRLVDLGPVEPIAAAVSEWRTLCGPRAGDAFAAAGARLRELLWLPMEEHLQGAEMLLISPDGELNGFPWAALPGRDPNTYLVEELGIAVIPAPQLLPELLAERPSPPTDRPPAMLLVGGVDFDAAAGDTPPPSVAATGRPWRLRREGALGKLAPLDATKDEVQDIGAYFETLEGTGGTRKLTGAAATKPAVCAAAPDHVYLHFATHGFFAPPELESALMPTAELRWGGEGTFTREGAIGFHPGLLSGLALAGANRPPTPEGSDGLLTALEVAELDLRGVELAVLSACDTGLGQVAGGEGVLGLQRAFQVAGARTTVASLWKVDDRMTSTFMRQFYKNHLQDGMSVLESLRETQLWMLREDPARGTVVLDREAADDRPPRASPYYWAAFVLSGDWR